jgi:hypothetical protein
MWSDAIPVARLMRVGLKKAKIAAMSTVKTLALLPALVLGTLALGCSSGGNQLAGAGGGSGKGGSGGSAQTTTETITVIQNGNPKLDILFVLDDGASSTEMQQKLNDQMPTFLNVLQALPTPPDLHIAVTTTDMGAPSDVMAQLMTTAQGDNGAFQNTPSGTCTSTTLMNGATYLADDGSGTANFTAPMATVLQCISLVGHSASGFPQPLAAAAHALGADNVVNGVPTPPATNVGFLRPDAYLAIIFLVDQDDCSVPAGTKLFSLNGGEQNLTNPLGPIALYRCNQFGHLCKDPASSDPQALIMPPLNPPSDAQRTGSTPTLDLTDCQDNDQGTGLLIPVSQLVSEIKALKSDPDNQIIVSSISAPPTPYTVAWVPAPAGEDTQPGELWPEIEHSCGAAGSDDVNPEATMNTTDGSAGDPGVRLAAFVNGFSDGLLASICDASYASSLHAIATKVGQLPGNGPCLTGQIQKDINALPNCTAVAQVADASGANKSVPYANCDANGNIAPCWTLTTFATSCVGETVVVTDSPGAPSSSVTVSCQICNPAGTPGASVPGC